MPIEILLAENAIIDHTLNLIILFLIDQVSVRSIKMKAFTTFILFYTLLPVAANVLQVDEPVVSTPLYFDYTVDGKIGLAE